MSEELKPCPFCGGTNIEIRPNRIGDFFAICYSNDRTEMACYAKSGENGCETEEGAVARWNARPTETTLTARVAELEKALEPFASASNAMEKVNDGRPLVLALWAGWSQREKTPLTVGDCRRARAALKPKE
jgi:hypothetical protein